MNGKIHYLSRLIEEQTRENLQKKLKITSNDLLDQYSKVSIVPGNKYIKIDIGCSGKYMIEVIDIYGVKAYGVINKKKYYGTLDTVDDYCWGKYTAVKKNK